MRTFGICFCHKVQYKYGYGAFYDVTMMKLPKLRGSQLHQGVITSQTYVFTHLIHLTSLYAFAVSIDSSTAPALEFSQTYTKYGPILLILALL